MFKVFRPVWYHIPLILVLGRQRWVDLCEFKVRLFYIVFSKPAKLYHAFNSGGSRVWPNLLALSCEGLEKGSSTKTRSYRTQACNPGYLVWPRRDDGKIKACLNHCRVSPRPAWATLQASFSKSKQNPESFRVKIALWHLTLTRTSWGPMRMLSATSKGQMSQSPKQPPLGLSS